LYAPYIFGNKLSVSTAVYIWSSSEKEVIDTLTNGHGSLEGTTTND